MAGCCKLTGSRVLCPCGCPGRSGHNIAVSLQQEKMLFSVLQPFISIWKSVIPLKVRALRMGYCVYFRLKAISFYKGAEPQD